MSESDPQVQKRWYTRIMDRYRYGNIYLPGFNLLTRNILKIRAESSYRRAQRDANQHQEEILDWFNARRIFFGHAVHRSGTSFLSNLLNQGAKQVIVMHEVNINDYWYYAKAIHSHEEALAYIRDYRLNEICRRLKNESFQTYGEINPFLRRHCAAISVVLPHATQFHVVRDPRKVIRSLMSRELLGRKDPMAKLVRPPVEDPLTEQWNTLSRFEKLCWLWASDNKFIRAHVSHNIRFEFLLKDFDYFREMVLDFLGLEMAESTWAAGVSSVNNATPCHAFPEFSDWSSSERRAFYSICGGEMAFYGYQSIAS